MKYLYLIFLLIPFAGRGQTVTGIVKNPANDPVPGLTVSELRSDNHTRTDENGHFKIVLTGKSNVLQFTGAAYDMTAVDVTGKASIEVTVTNKNNKLDEVQVIAYGTTTQRYNVGSVSKVTSEEIDKQNVDNPLQALQGRVAGLVVTSTSGLPGAALTVQIRGQNTLKAASTAVSPRDNPLYIIDGIPFATQNNNVNQFSSIASPGTGLAFNNAYGGESPFNSINPADIESIEILRDASATAIYGSRGGNGVILITTKKGKIGKTEFSANVRNGISFIGYTMPMMNTQQYLSMRREAYKNDGLTPSSVAGDAAYAPDLLVFDTTRYTDWKKVFIGNKAHSLNAVTSLSGGTENTQFRLSSGFSRDTYIFPGNYADEKANFSTSIHHSSLNKKFTLDFTAGYSYDLNNSSNSSALLMAYTLEPNYPAPVDASGNIIWDYKGVSLGGSNAGINPYYNLKMPYNIQNINLNSSMLLAYKVTKDLKIKTNIGYNTFNSKEYSATPLAAQDPIYSPVSQARFGSNDFTTWIIEPQIEYNTTIKKGLLNILIGATIQQNKNTATETDGYGYINDALLGSISGTTTVSATDAYKQYKYAAVFGRINYRYDDKYLVDITVRRDGSSRFGPEKQFGTFGSAGAGWLFTEESFLKNQIPLLSYGKLRGSYGITGSDAVADYQYISRWAPTQYTYGGSTGYAPQNLYNPQLGWATTKKLEFGLELGFLNDRILLNTDRFRNRSGDQLITYPLPSQTGFKTVYENWDAVVQNSGVEIAIQAAIIKNTNFSWNSSFNITIPENKLISFPNIETSSYSTTYFLGKSLSTVTGFRYGGVSPATGDFQVYNAAGQISTNPVSPSQGRLNDYVIIGNTDPKCYGGWQNSFSFKRIQLDVFADFRKQMGLNYLSQIYGNVPPGFELNLPAVMLDRWQAPGQQTNIQKFSSQFGNEYAAGSNILQSSAVYSDASFIKIRSITLSYQVPNRFLSKINVKSMKFYVNAQNLFTITSYKGNDPETQSIYGVPPLKSISLGLNLNL